MTAINVAAYIMLVFGYSSGVHVQAVEFKSKAACENAVYWVKQQDYIRNAFCVPAGDKK